MTAVLALVLLQDRVTQFARKVPLLGDAYQWARHEINTMNDTTFTLSVGGLVLVLALAVLAIRPVR